MHEKLNSNGELRSEYVRLVRKRGARRFAMVMGPWAAKLEEEEERELLKDETPTEPKKEAKADKKTKAAKKEKPTAEAKESKKAAKDAAAQAKEAAKPVVA